MADNWDRDPIWRNKQARWTVKDLTKAIHEMCKWCNCVDVWHNGNDCVSEICPLFPFRPGEQRSEATRDGIIYHRAKSNPNKVAQGLKNVANLHRGGQEKAKRRVKG